MIEDDRDKVARPIEDILNRIDSEINKKQMKYNIKDRANCCDSGTKCISQYKHSWTLVLGSGYSIVEYCPWCGYKLPEIKIEPKVTTGKHGKSRIYKKKTNPETNESIYIYDGHEMVCKYCMGDGRASADRPCSYCK